MRLQALLFCFACLAVADEAYQKPSKDIVDVLSAPATPRAFVSPSRNHVLLAEPLRYPPIADLAQPMLRLAGVRINPKNNGPHRGTVYTSLFLKRLGDGADVKIQLPANAKITAPKWSPDGKQFAFTNSTVSAIELWIGDAATGHLRRIEGLRVNAALAPTFPGQPDQVYQWMDNRKLLVETVPTGRGAPPSEPAIPKGPHTQESSGHTGPIRTYEDMLANAHDEDLFDYYATAQLMIVDTASGQAQAYGKPAIFDEIDPAPDAQHVLVARVHRPYSYLHPYPDFPKEVEVWNSAAKLAYKVASLPLADRVPIDGVPTGPRDYEWRPTEPATLFWVEAMDGGNPKEKVPHRDRIVMLKAPFGSEPQEVYKTEERFRGMEFGAQNGTAFVQDYERDKRRGRMFYLTSDHPSEPKVLWSLNVQDRYHSPGALVTTRLANGRPVVQEEGESVFLAGAGASPKGDHPFLDKMNVKTGKAERLFQSSDDR